MAIHFAVADLDPPCREPFAVLKIDTDCRIGGGVKATVVSLHWERDEAGLYAEKLGSTEQ